VIVCACVCMVRLLMVAGVWEVWPHWIFGYVAIGKFVLLISRNRWHSLCLFFNTTFEALFVVTRFGLSRS